MSATSATHTGTASPRSPQSSQPSQSPQQPTSPSHGRHVVAVVVLVPVLVALALWAFAWPAARTAPRDLPLGVAGPATAVTQVQKQLEEHEGAFEIHRYADEAAARDAIEDRTVYGAVVVTEQGPKLLTASAASPFVAQLLQQAVTQQAGGAQVRTVDVVPAAKDDPRGSALTSSVLPLTLAGIAAGAVVTLLGLRGRRAIVALVGASVLVGLVAATLAGSWLGALTGNWWAQAGALGLATLAVGAAVAGLAALLGPPGIGLGGLVVMLLGNPFSGAATAPEMLPDPVGAIGQWLPPGAGVSLLRSISFFDGAAASGPALTLAWWAALGLGAILLGSALKGRKEAKGPTLTEHEPAPAN
ncbi:ABC transporter permease [Streptomyces umbrinus]|uniref:ABC transporter permease n=1 Tax=Streptomyces umbrinus TaxID=67370 RepID=UPI0033E994E7